MSYFKVNEKCNGCLACVQNCPANALDYVDNEDKRTLKHNMALCARCAQCWRVCPQQAIEFRYFLKADWYDVASFELVRCKICGEPLHTVPYGTEVYKKLNTEADALCPKHRQISSALSWLKPKQAADKNRS